MKFKTEWRIYYEDRERHYKEGLPDTAEDHLGVLVIAQRREGDGRLFTIYGNEYYLFDGNVWIPVGLNGLEDWTMNLLPRIKCVIKGRAISHGIYRQIFEKAKADAAKDTLD